MIYIESHKKLPFCLFTPLLYFSKEGKNGLSAGTSSSTTNWTRRPKLLIDGLYGFERFSMKILYNLYKKFFREN